MECSPFQRNVFCSCGIDGTVRIYNTLQSKALTMLEPASVYLYTVKWSPFRPLVLAASTGNGKIALYDLLSSKLHPAKVSNSGVGAVWAALGSGAYIDG